MNSAAVRRGAVNAALVLALSLGQGRGATPATVSLKATHGGALVVGALKLPRADELMGVWSSVGRARLMRCTPRCEVVTSIPVSGTLVLGQDTGYRVVLGGTFRAGQKVSLVLRLRNAQIMNLMATVAR
ncbi:hypothetical protein LAJ19_07350 [Deinococcus taeanensis]|uniref:hypothetical protein n=1 Tax=Deinococcus taeanensis TaxID=2737050 RepID=UPI001CDB6592|nr:hypothetical protein [Deinococcus taeanensis]UBV41486.1 hypothetical protein LAJ19_07350 [Deinococcus taeanensis]